MYIHHTFLLSPRGIIVAEIVLKKFREHGNCLEVVLKPPLGLNFCVGLRRSILEIFPIFLRLAASVPRSCPADLGRETLNPIEGFETTSSLLEIDHFR